MATPVDGRDERAGAVGGGLGSTAADFLQRCSAGVQNQFFRDAVSVEKMKVITHDLSNGASHEKVEAELALGLACHPLVLQYWGKDKVPVKIWTLGSDAAARKASQMVIESKLPRFDLVRGNFDYDEVARDGSDVSPAFPDWRKCITGAPGARVLAARRTEAEAPRRRRSCATMPRQGERSSPEARWGRSIVIAAGADPRVRAREPPCWFWQVLAVFFRKYGPREPLLFTSDLRRAIFSRNT